MKTIKSTFALLALAIAGLNTGLAQETLPSWNDGPAKTSILEFVTKTTMAGSPDFVPHEERIATFDQDGTLWVEHPMYSFVIYALQRVPVLVKAKPELKEIEPCKTVLSGKREAVAKLSLADLEEIIAATFTGMPVDDFNAEVKKWIARTLQHAAFAPRPFKSQIFGTQSASYC